MKTDSDSLILEHHNGAPRNTSAAHRRHRLVKALILGLLLALVAGCGEQAEGDRCDPRNGNTDCESGLACTPLERLGQGREGAICCPPPPANPSELICTPATFDLGVGDDDDDDDDQGKEDAATPAGPLDAASGLQDASHPLTDAATLDASGDAASRATSDAALDAAADADVTD